MKGQTKVKHIHPRKLKKKGWTDEEIQKAKIILGMSHLKKSNFVKKLDFLIYWLILLAVIVGNFIISVTIVPILLVMSGGYLVLMLLVLGVFFGFTFSQVIKEVEHFQKGKVVVAELLIPVIGLLNIYMIVKLTNALAVPMELPTGIHSPVLVSVLYVAAFSFPRIYDVVVKRDKHTKHI